MEHTFGAIEAGFVNHLRGIVGRSVNTIKAYTSDLRRFAADTGITSVEGITYDAVTNWITESDYSGTPRSTLARRAAALKGFTSWAAQAGHLTADPLPGLKVTDPGKQLPEFLDEYETTQLMEEGSPGDQVKALRDRAMLEVLYSTGCRVSELCGLDVTDVRPRLKQVKVRGKGGKERLIPIGQPALDAVAAYLEIRPLLEKPGQNERALFLGLRRGRRIGRREVARVVSQCSGRAGTPAIGPHGLRHSAATHMLDHDADVRVLQIFLGHASLASTQKYTHVSIKRVARTHEMSHPRA